MYHNDHTLAGNTLTIIHVTRILNPSHLLKSASHNLPPPFSVWNILLIEWRPCIISLVIFSHTFMFNQPARLHFEVTVLAIVLYEREDHENE